LILRSGGVPTRLQELLYSLDALFIGGRLKHIQRHGLPRIVQRHCKRTQPVQVAVRTGPYQQPKRIRGQEHDEHVERTAMPDHDRPHLRSSKDDARLRKFFFAYASGGTLEEPVEAATRSRGKVAQMLAVSRSLDPADDETANALPQRCARFELSKRCIAPRNTGTLRCRNRSIRLPGHI
jgi:hypothetical protein